MIDLKKLAELPYREAAKVLKTEGHWTTETFKVEVTGYNILFETKTVKVKAIDAVSAEIEAKEKSGFNVVVQTQIIGDE
jgi:hypothetical protein